MLKVSAFVTGPEQETEAFQGYAATLAVAHAAAKTFGTKKMALSEWASNPSHAYLSGVVAAVDELEDLAAAAEVARDDPKCRP